MALRLGMSHCWIGKPPACSKGTVQDGINLLSRPRAIVDRQRPARWLCRKGVRFKENAPLWLR
jgi:hypothetical protein